MNASVRLISAMTIALASFGVAANAQERPLTGEEIRAALAGKSVTGERRGKSWSQSFDESGATTYVSDGRPSPGRWRVDGDRYCSQWPPASRWDCYKMTGDLTASPPTVTWIYPDGTRWPGTIE